MKRTPLVGGVLLVLALGAGAQPQAGTSDVVEAPSKPSSLDAQLFYQLLLGELDVRDGEAGVGFNLVLDAARKTNDPALYQRAVEIAFQARSGESALQAARAWKQAFPQSRDANRFVLQLLIALNRLPETEEPLKADIALTPAPERVGTIAIVPRLYARATDKKLAAAIVERALADELTKPDTGPVAWSAVGRMRLLAGDAPGAIHAGQRAQSINPQSEAPALLGLEMMDPGAPEAETLVKRYIDGKPLPEFRMAYARALLEAQRYGEATKQVQAVTAEKPDYPEAWLVQGTLQLQDNQDAAAEASLKRYLQLAQAQSNGDERSRGMAQAYLSLSRIAEKRKDYAQASTWLDRIDDPQDLIAATQRRASILARQGKLEEGRQLIRSLPVREEGDARLKLLAEVQLLRDNKQFKAAYDLLGQAAAEPPFDPDVVYDQAMIAERMGDISDMERLLRKVIAEKPDYYQAYNALGYSLAERNMRLPEAKSLIQKALTYAPDDAYISDSLAWVEYRMGNKAEALRILDTAYKARPDADIAAHLGEVLWSMGERDRAHAIFKEGLLLNSDNDTLQETMKRLRVRP